MYDYMCGKCGGLVPEPMKAYSYAGRYCHCATPTPPIGRTVTTSTPTPHREEHTEWDVVEQIGIASFGGIAFKPTQEYREKIMKIIDSLLKDQRERIREEIEKTDAMETVDSARLTSYTVIDETTRTKWVKIDTILNLPSFKD